MPLIPGLDVQTRSNGIFVDLMLNGDWVDVTEDVYLTTITFTSGMSDGLPNTRVANDGTCEFKLDNSEFNSAKQLGYYSPGGLFCRPGFQRNVRCRIVIWYQGTAYYRFVGRLKTIDPLYDKHGARYTQCEGRDFFTELANAMLEGVTVAQSQTADQMLTSLINIMTEQPIARNFDVGARTFTYGLAVGSSGKTNALQEAQRVTMSEFGYLYVRSDTATGGVLRLENRNYRRDVATSAFTLTAFQQNPASFSPFAASSRAEDVFNDVQVTYHPRRIDQNPVILYSKKQRLFLVGPTSSISLTAPYSDPTQPATSGTGTVAGVGLLTPVAGQDYVGSANEDGTGTDLTSFISVTAVDSGTGAIVTITNNGATPAWVSLQLRSQGVYAYDKLTATVENVSSQRLYGQNTLTIDLPYEDDPTNANEIAERVSSVWSTPFPNCQSVGFIVDLLSDFEQELVALDIGDRVTVAETLTGVSGDFFINGVSMSVWENSKLSVSWILAPASFGETAPTAPSGTVAVSYLIVGGGGTGGDAVVASGDGHGMGGGGGGQVVQGTDILVTTPGSFPVVVAAALGSSSFNGHSAAPGTVAIGDPTESQGSGGNSGSGQPGSVGWGGFPQRGGGGGGDSGTSPGYGTSGPQDGGPGTQANMDGNYYGGGGGGGARNDGGNVAGVGGIGGGGAGGLGAGGVDGTPNTGGGGGGSFLGGQPGGVGGTGIVKLRYLTGTVTATGGMITTSGPYTIHTFTSSDSFVIT